MTYFDASNLDRLTPEQKKQYEAFLKAYPHLQPKMEVARQLNTPAAQEMRQKAPKMPPSNVEDFDPTQVEEEQKAQAAVKRPPQPLGEMRIDPASYASFAPEAPQPPQQEEPVPPPPQQKQPAAKFSPLGKRHPIVQKMRQSLGMDALSEPATIVVSGISYEMHRLMREELTMATALASARSLDDLSNLRSNIESAIVAFSTRKIDGINTEDAFEVPQVEFSLRTGKDEPLSLVERQGKGSHLMYEFLVDAPTELTETLITFYEQKFPQLSLLDKQRVFALCPVQDCQYKAIINVVDTRYCIYHGKELKKEGDLPNPS